MPGLPETLQPTSPIISFIGVADDAILRAVNRYHLVTAEQICRLLYRPSVIAYARGRLSHLARSGYLLRSDLLRMSRLGTGPIVYSLGPKGRTYLRALGEPVPARLRKYAARQYGTLHLRHALGVTDVLIAADLLAKREPRLRVHRALNEHALKRLAVSVDLPDGKRITVCPDAWLDLRVRRDRWYQTCVALELDRGTEHQPAWRHKVRALLAWAQGPYAQRFGTDALTVAVLTTAGEERKRALLRWTEAELAACDEQVAADLFAVAAGAPSTLPPADLFLAPRWSVPFTPKPVPLLRLDDASG